MSATTAVRERPIPFSGEMVLAILAGRKTETRRVIRPQPPADAETAAANNYAGPEGPSWFWFKNVIEDGGITSKMWPDTLGGARPVHCPFGSPGEKLWVREAWRYAGSLWSGETPKVRTHEVEYAADGRRGEYPLPEGQEAVPPHVCRCKDSDEHREQLLRRHSRVRPPMFMPRWASRLTLELDEVRVERLQEITEEGARAEGVTPLQMDGGSFLPSFEGGWDKLHAKRPERQWSASPWVWVLRFHVIPQEVAGA